MAEAKTEKKGERWRSLCTQHYLHCNNRPIPPQVVQSSLLMQAQSYKISFHYAFHSKRKHTNRMFKKKTTIDPFKVPTSLLHASTVIQKHPPYLWLNTASFTFYHSRGGLPHTQKKKTPSPHSTPSTMVNTVFLQEAVTPNIIA